MSVAAEKPTVAVSNLPQTVTVLDLRHFLESQLGNDSIFTLEISTERKQWKSRSFGRIQFNTLEAKLEAMAVPLTFESHTLRLSETTYEDIVVRPVEPKHRLNNCVLHAGFFVRECCMSVLESWEGVRVWVMPERRRVEFWVWQGSECYKLEIMFHDVLETVRCSLADRDADALVLKLKYGPKIYQKISGPDIDSKFSADRYNFCKEDFDFRWVRTIDFSTIKSIGQSTSFCWQIEGLLASDIFTSFPRYREDVNDLILEDAKELSSTSETVPLVKCNPASNLAYEILFQINSLVQTQKISLGAGTDLIEILSKKDVETAFKVLQKMHKLNFTCYESDSFVKTQLHVLERNCKSVPPSSYKRLEDQNVLSCHRALITPSKIYCLGPELETSNYVVKHFASYASDFMRVTFFEEDWSKLPANAISTSIQRGIFAKPFRTGIYRRILSVLQDGIVIGAKRFQFLAFSGSQLRSNSVWMFASNDKVKAKDIREWMGCFNKIRSVSKCAARMGQLFSSSKQTLEVHGQDVEIIPDIKVISDDIDYCFSDGIGKISESFGWVVAQKCGLNRTPSAFQIRYGRYKGVVAVD
ncbi:hypothetical protein SO802_007296 [Lithocarpus litseifolius]|uniref:RNA-dependent RNA polymerase n=1 Tax=Lithocarpus litseifolius TaxID=425828 RepID=A0AAW2DRJ1_9ROSI